MPEGAADLIQVAPVTTPVAAVVIAEEHAEAEEQAEAAEQTAG